MPRSLDDSDDRRETPRAPLVRRWRPASAVRHHAVVFIGRDDNAENYERFGSRLAFDGTLVSVVDTTPTSAGDVVDAWQRAIEQEPADVPVVAIAVDVAAPIVAGATAAQRITPDGIVIAGGTTGEGATTSIDERTSCPLHADRLQKSASPLIRPLGTPTRWPSEAVTVPTLLIHGSEDSAAALPEALGATADWPAREVAIVRGGRHDILNDRSHRSVAAAVVQFLERLREDPGAADIIERHAAGSTALELATAR